MQSPDSSRDTARLLSRTCYRSYYGPCIFVDTMLSPPAHISWGTVAVPSYGSCNLRLVDAASDFPIETINSGGKREVLPSNLIGSGNQTSAMDDGTSNR
jgi:hypothetical protein